jgi:transglutaminase-like putative cysteine protease
MLLRVVHETRYDYTPQVKTAQHVAHLRPAHDRQQSVLAHRLDIAPAPAQRKDSTDVFGNTRTFFSLQAVHESLRVVADSLVATRPRAQPGDSMPWEEARERMRYHRAAHYDAAAEFMFASPYVPRDEAFVAYARSSFAAGRPLAQAARALMTRIHDDFIYETAATDAGTPALEALALRKGVCQDFAHVMLACLRSLGLPARYVSGYLFDPSKPPDAILASHAWAEVFLDGRGWLGLDPTHDRPISTLYTRTAIGRDYADAAPVRGVYQGGAQETLEVRVRMRAVGM